MTYQSPEILEIGDAAELIQGGGFGGNDCCTCGKKSSDDVGD